MAGKNRNGFSVNVFGMDIIKQNVAFLVKKFPEIIGAINLSTGREVQAQAERNILDIDAYDTGELHGSLAVHSFNGGLSVVVACNAKHAPYIEFGTGPHFPPVEKIRAWCIRKGIPPGAAYPIARKIAERGTPERPFLQPAWEAAKRGYIDRIRWGVDQGLRGGLKKVDARFGS